MITSRTFRISSSVRAFSLSFFSLSLSFFVCAGKGRDKERIFLQISRPLTRPADKVEIQSRPVVGAKLLEASPQPPSDRGGAAQRGNGPVAAARRSLTPAQGAGDCENTRKTFGSPLKKIEIFFIPEGAVDRIVCARPRQGGRQRSARPRQTGNAVGHARVLRWQENGIKPYRFESVIRFFVHAAVLGVGPVATRNGDVDTAGCTTGQLTE